MKGKEKEGGRRIKVRSMTDETAAAEGVVEAPRGRQVSTGITRAAEGSVFGFWKKAGDR
jgi:hypothetical protein